MLQPGGNVAVLIAGPISATSISSQPLGQPTFYQPIHLKGLKTNL
jgi:hypothetical protein